MMDLNIFRKNPNESVEEYTDRVCKLKQEYRLTWEELKDIINEQTGGNRSESYYRKNFGKKTRDLDEDYSDDCQTNQSTAKESVDDEDDVLTRIKKEKMKLSDYRVQTNADLRRISREETIKEIAHDYAVLMAENKAFLLPTEESKETQYERSGSGKSAILCISDWHYGIVVDNFWNRYDPDIAKKRISNLCDQVIYLCSENNISDLRLVNLADLICGRIHLPLRLQSRFDVITQIMDVSEILAEFITKLTNDGIFVEYYDCVDNHSRLEPNKNDALEVETLARITKWYLKERLSSNELVHINGNDFGDDIVCFDCRGHKVAGVHGDKDKPTTVVDNISLMTKEHFDLILTAHMHHFSADEKNETIVVSNGSLMGTDEYARKLRLSAKPSQNFIVVTDKCVIDSIHRILVD